MLLQDYDRHERIYAPVVAKSKLQSRDGDRFRFFLRFAMKKVITVVVNSEHEAIFTRGAPIARKDGYTARESLKWRIRIRRASARGRLGMTAATCGG